ncbi:MAG: ATP-grasp domain-containing protein [Bacteroidales bacterium]|jgi:D-alanine-D-alanine ligase|nr:ATP-grasp domain-containing protein [Bacteroidales bacterium]
MTIGLTYDLRSEYLKEGFSEEETAEFDKEETVAALDDALTQLGYDIDRIGHARQLIGRLAQGDRWDMVFNICEGMHGIGREAQVPAILDIYNIPYTFSDPLVLALTLHKAMTKRVVRDAGISTPDFALVEDLRDIDKVNLPYPLFVKPYAEGTGKGIDASSKVSNKAKLEETCRLLLPKFSPGLIVETFLPGREFTIAIVGTGDEARSLGVMEVMFTAKAEAHGYSYLNKEDYKGRVNYRIVNDGLAERCAIVALAAWRSLTCRDAGRVDLRLDSNGHPGFIEVNPLAGLNPIHSDLPIICHLQGIPFVELIRIIMDSAKKRLPSNESKHSSL